MQTALPLIIEVDRASTTPAPPVEAVSYRDRELVRRADVVYLSFTDGMARCVKDRDGTRDMDKIVPIAEAI